MRVIAEVKRTDWLGNPRDMNDKRTIGKGCSGRFIKPLCGAAFNGVVLSDRVKAYAVSCRTSMRMVWAEALSASEPLSRCRK